MEIVGVEPTTPCLQSRCSSQLSYTPVLIADANMILFFESDKYFSVLLEKSFDDNSGKTVERPSCKYSYTDSDNHISKVMLSYEDTAC